MKDSRNNFGTVLRAYLHSRWQDMLIGAISAGLFGLVLALHDAPVAAVAYAALLAAALWLAYGVWGFARFCTRHQALAELQARVTLSLAGLPEPRGLLEADYQTLLETVQAHKTRLLSAADGERRDLADYYTLWAHQIKTPIAALRLLLEGSSAAEAAALRAEVFKIEQYVDMALTYLKLGDGAADLSLSTCDLDEVVRGAVRKYAQLFILKKLRLDYEPLNCRVLTDSKWLAFVMEQLLSNALKYTQTGGVSITLSAGPTLVIADTGIGIAAEDLPRLGEKGFTGYNGRGDKKATGIGLYLCKRILTKLNHTIAIASEPGRGTIVRISLARAGIAHE